MSATNNSNELSIDQLKTILSNDHIRQHLIQVGYINHRGDVIQKDDYERRSSRPYSSYNQRSYPISAITNPKRENGSRSPDFKSNNRRRKSVSTVQSKETNKSRTSTRSSLLNQSTYIHNVLLRRAVSPQIILGDARCLVSLIYLGPDLNIEYERDYFEPEGDEILIMQQHCGGENYVVFKGFLQPDDEFSFESRRHADYPFALAFYVNGIIKNRLSVCCESRCKNYMRIGGKHCLFAIKTVEKEKACRRCRYEQRMKKLLETDPKSTIDADRRLHRHRKSIKIHTSRFKSPITRTKSSKPTSENTARSEANAARNSSPKQKRSDSDSTVPRTIESKPTKARTSSTESIESDILGLKSTISRTKSSKTNGTHGSSLQQTETGKSSPEPSVPRTKNSETNAARSLSPQQVESGTLSPNLAVSRTKSTKINGALNSSPQPIESDLSSPEPSVSRTKSFETKGARDLSPQPIESDASSPELIVPRKKNSKTKGVRDLSPQPIESDVSSSPEPSVSRTKTSKTNGARNSSLQQTETGNSSLEPIVPRTKSSKTKGARNSSSQQVASDGSSPEPTVPRTLGSEERHESSPPPSRVRSTTVGNHRPPTTNSSNPYDSDFEEPVNKIQSSISNPHDNKPVEVSSSEPSHITAKPQHHVVTVSTKNDNDVEIATISDESDTDFGRFIDAEKRRNNTDD